jgi:hypothetical protein
MNTSKRIKGDVKQSDVEQNKQMCNTKHSESWLHERLAIQVKSQDSADSAYLLTGLTQIAALKLNTL